MSCHGVVAVDVSYAGGQPASRAVPATDGRRVQNCLAERYMVDGGSREPVVVPFRRADVGVALLIFPALAYGRTFMCGTESKFTLG